MTAALRVGYPLFDPPYSRRNAVGQPEGASLTLLRAAVAQAGLAVADLVPLAPPQALAALQSGQVDVLMGVVDSPLRHKQMTLLGPYQRSPVVIATHGRYSVLSPDALAGQRVAVPRALAQQGDWLKRWPQVQWVDSDDEQAALAALALRQVDAALGGLHAMVHQLHTHTEPEWKTLRLTGLVQGWEDARYMAVLPTRAALAHQLERALAQLPAQQLGALEQAYADRRQQGGLNWERLRRWVMAATGLGMLLLAGALWHSRAMGRERARTLTARRQADHLLGFLAHEVRNTLQSVMGALALWRDSSGRSIERPPALTEALAQAASHAVGQLDGLLDQRRLQTGTLGLQRRPEPLGRVVQDIVDELRPLAHGRGQDIVFEARSGADSWWLVDAFRLQQVLRNLITHALRADGQGVVMVEMALQPANRGADWGQWALAVSDQGPDLDTSTRQHLFESPDPPDSQLPEDPPTPSANMGLRLARDLVKAMGGTLRMESRPVRGNCFILHLELEAAGVGAEAPGRPLQHVLLVEDTRAYALLLQQALVAQGTRVVRVDSVAAAARQLRDQNPGAPSFDLVLCDSHLPDGGLVEMLALRQQRRAQGQTAPPVIGMSADFDTDDIERLAALGALDLLTKDADLPDLVRRIQRSWAAQVLD